MLGFNVGSAFVTVHPNLTAFSKELSAGLAPMGKQLSATGQKLTRNLTLPMLGVGTVATKMALDFETATQKIGALTGASAKQTEKWGKVALELGPKLGVGPTEFANALYFVASSGAKVNQVVPITTQAVKDAAAGMGDAQTVAQLLTSAVNAYGAQNLSAAKASDILTAAIRVGKAEPQELADSLGRVIPLANEMGVSFAETAASVSALTNTGLDAAEATTAVRAVLTTLIKPSAQTKKAMDNLGLSAAGLRTEIKDKGLNDTLLELKNRVGDNQTALGHLFPNVRAMTGFLALTGKNAEGVARALDTVEHSTGAAGDAFRKASQSDAFKFRKSLAEVEAQGIKLGTVLLPIVSDILHDVTGLAKAFSSLPDELQKVIEVGAGLALVAGPALTLAGGALKIAGAFGKIAKIAPEAAAGIEGTEVAATGAAASFNPLLAGALVAAGVAFVAVKKASEDSTTASDNYTKTVVANTSKLVSSHNQLSQTIKQGGKSVKGWNILMSEAGKVASTAADKIQNDLNWSYGKDYDILHNQLNRVVANYVSQLQGVAQHASAAAQDSEHFGKAARAQYAHVAALASAAAQLAAAMNAIPSRKTVELFVSITSKFQTEGIAPGMGADESSHAGPGQKRAAGGPVSGGMPYLVGERGPEVFVPRSSGRIVPNNRLGSGRLPVALVVEDGPVLNGYIEEIADDTYSKRAGLGRQMGRMRGRGGYKQS